MLALDDQHLRVVLTEFVRYHDAERSHRTLGMEVPEPRPRPTTGPVRSRPVPKGYLVPTDAQPETAEDLPPDSTGVVASDWVFTPETEPPRVFFRCTLSAPVRTEFSFSLVLPGDNGRALADAETALAATRRPSSPSATGPRR